MQCQSLKYIHGKDHGRPPIGNDEVTGIVLTEIHGWDGMFSAQSYINCSTPSLNDLVKKKKKTTVSVPLMVRQVFPDSGLRWSVIFFPVPPCCKPAGLSFLGYFGKDSPATPHRCCAQA